MQESVITEVIIGIRYQDREAYPPPELAEFFRHCGGSLLDHLGDLKVAALVADTGFEHSHRAGVPDAICALTVEAVDYQDCSVSYPDQPGVRDSDPRPAGQVKRYFLPRHYIPRIRACAREFGDGNSAIAIHDVRFRPGAAKGTGRRAHEGGG